jgi:hypothetical protein
VLKNKKITGRVLAIHEEIIYCAKGYKIFQSVDNGQTWKIWTTIPVSPLDKFIVLFPLLARLLRKGVHHLVISKKVSVIIANKESYSVIENISQLIEPLHGSRPMILCKTKTDDIYCGEYHSNPNRNPVSIWNFDIHKNTWKSVWILTGIRHIHGVFDDPYTNSIWVTTGDSNSETGIWKTDDNFTTLQKIVGDSQQFRAVQLLFTKDYIYFGSDTPYEQNYIYRMDREGQNLKKLISVNSSIFYGYKVKDTLFFSTAIEPSRVNKTRYSEVWYSDNGADWYKLLEFKKDVYPLKFFQYGQVLFPSGESNDKYLYLTPFATEDSNKSIIIDLTDKENTN